MNSNNKQSGSIIVFTLLSLGVMLLIGLTLAAIFIPKIRIQNSASSSVGAIYAADSAIEWCIYINRGKPALAAPTMVIGSSYTIAPSDCTIDPLNHQAVGTYGGVSRSLNVEE